MLGACDRPGDLWLGHRFTGQRWVLASDQPGDFCHSGVPMLQHTDCGPLTFPGSPGPDRVKLYNFFYTQVAILLSTI